MSIQESWAAAKGTSDEFAASFAEILADSSQELKALLKDKLTDASKIFLGGVDAGLKSLDDAKVSESGKQLHALGAGESQLDAFGFALLATLEKLHKSSWNSQIEEAWSKFFEQLSPKLK